MKTLYCSARAFEIIEYNPSILTRLHLVGVFPEFRNIRAVPFLRPLCGCLPDDQIMVLETKSMLLYTGTKLEDWIESKEKLKFLQEL